MKNILAESGHVFFIEDGNYSKCSKPKSQNVNESFDFFVFLIFELFCLILFLEQGHDETHFFKNL